MLDDTIFPGDGEMARRMRHFDWGHSPLGDPRGWPHALRTVVRVLLQSRYAMFVWWGPQFIQIYNDGYMPILGRRHPDALGKPAREVWTDVWDVVGPQAQSVITRGISTWNERLLLVMQRHGYTEEAYFTFSYSPAYDDDGAIGGVFCAVTEETARVLGERRLEALASLASATAGSEGEAQACARAVGALEQFGYDLPFVALYLKGDAAPVAVSPLPALVGTTDTQSDAVPGDLVRVQWPFDAAAHAGWAVVDDLPAHGLTVAAGPWPEPIGTAVVVPLVTPAEGAAPTAFLVAGLSPRRQIDLEYRRFVELVALQIGKALSDARQVEHERQRARELAELDRAKTVFFSNISHEFRTPLTLMLGPLEEMARRVPPDAETRELLFIARTNAQRLLRLVNALLDFARIESGRIDALFAPTDLAALTADLASTFRSACERAGLALVVDCPPLTRPVFVDRGLWEKIVLNLVSNAFKFTHDGEIRVRLRERARAGTEGVAELAVEDTGIGIAASDKPRLFRRFERIEGSRGRSFEGSGIGLSMVAELAQVHGGSAAVESTLGQGSRFVITIPFGTAHLPAEAVVAESAAAGTSPTADLFAEEALRWLDGDAAQRDDIATTALPATGSAPALGDAAWPHVLVADDNADMRRYVRRILAAEHRVTLACDGEEAWQRIEAEPPDLVIADVMMPRLDGFGLIARMRAQERTRGLPVIALSARAGEESRVEGLNAGADDYVAKPFVAGELLARVNAQLRLADAARDRAGLLAREQHARAEAELQRRQLRDIFEQAPTLIAVLRGAEHVVELANALICRAWGRRQEDVIGRPFFDAVPEARDQPWRTLLDGVYRSGQPFVGREVPAQFDREGRLETSFYDFVWAPLIEDGAVDGIIVVATDVTEQVLARRQLSGLREAAEAANRAKDEFLAMLGHELRNPLAPIMTALQLLKLRGVEAVERERAIIERQLRQVVTLVDDLLDVSRIMRGKVELKRTFVELADVVAKAIEMASPLLEQQRHELRVDVPRGGLSVLADANRLAQVVANVLNNAAKYTEPGGLVEVFARAENGDVVLGVRDSGVGIAPELLPHVFDLFVQERQSSARSRGGLGLGLTIVRSLVELHGGTVAAQSEGENRGTTFTIRLPHVPAHAADEYGPLGPDALLQGAAVLPLRVLIVDDNTDAADMLGELLSRFGCVVHVAHDGPAALAAATVFLPDVALVDIGLPVLDGYEVARRLKRLPSLAGVRLIAVTGYGQAQDRERSAAAGFDAHLVKPLDGSELLETLAHLMPIAERPAGR